MLKYILPVIPAHDTYIEPFAGGLAVFLAKARVKVEVINDLNDEVSGFYLYVREHLDAMAATFAGKYFRILRKSKCLLNIQRERAIESALNVLR